MNFSTKIQELIRKIEAGLYDNDEVSDLIDDIISEIISSGSEKAGYLLLKKLRGKISISDLEGKELLLSLNNVVDVIEIEKRSPNTNNKLSEDS